MSFCSCNAKRFSYLIKVTSNSLCHHSDSDFLSKNERLLNIQDKQKSREEYFVLTYLAITRGHPDYFNDLNLLGSWLNIKSVQHQHWKKFRNVQTRIVVMIKMSSNITFSNQILCNSHALISFPHNQAKSTSISNQFYPLRGQN